MSQWTLVAAALALAGCAGLSAGDFPGRASTIHIDGITLGENVTPARLKATAQKFDCTALDKGGRSQLCWPESPDSQPAVVVLLDERVVGFIRTFDLGAEHAAEQWSLSVMGVPSSRKAADSRIDLLWDEKEAPFARLLTHLEDVGGESAFLVMTRDLERFLDKHPEVLEKAPERDRKPEGMTPGKCLAIPLLCPAA